MAGITFYFTTGNHLKGMCVMTWSLSLLEENLESQDESKNKRNVLLQGSRGRKGLKAETFRIHCAGILLRNLCFVGSFAADTGLLELQRREGQSRTGAPWSSLGLRGEEEGSQAG